MYRRAKIFGFGNEGGYAVTGSLWVSWKNRILGNGGCEAFDPFEARVLKSPPDPDNSYALRTRCARADRDDIVMRGTGVPGLGGDCVEIRLGKLDRVGRTVAVYPCAPSDGNTAQAHDIRWINPDRHNMAAPMSDMGGEMTRLSLLENEAV